MDEHSTAAQHGAQHGGARDNPFAALAAEPGSPASPTAPGGGEVFGGAAAAAGGGLLESSGLGGGRAARGVRGPTLPPIMSGEVRREGVRAP
jgi:hypothetical protein